jgi:hypothetical protein
MAEPQGLVLDLVPRSENLLDLVPTTEINAFGSKPTLRLVTVCWLSAHKPSPRTHTNAGKLYFTSWCM